MRAALPLAMLVAFSALLLAGCGASDQEELQAWMTEQRNQTKSRVPPIAEPKKFTPQNYLGDGGAADPFSNQKLTQALKKESNQPSGSTALVAPELARRKEALESYPLDGMAMVGYLIKEGQPAAIMKVNELLYMIRTGAYLGQNFGKVTKISEGEITLREIVQDSAGEWIERVSKIQLQEGSK